MEFKASYSFKVPTWHYLFVVAEVHSFRKWLLLTSSVNQISGFLHCLKGNLVVIVLVRRNEI